LEHLELTLSCRELQHFSGNIRLERLNTLSLDLMEDAFDTDFMHILSALTLSELEDLKVVLPPAKSQFVGLTKPRPIASGLSFSAWNPWRKSTSGTTRTDLRFLTTSSHSILHDLSSLTSIDSPSSLGRRTKTVAQSRTSLSRKLLGAGGGATLLQDLTDVGLVTASAFRFPRLDKMILEQKVPPPPYIAPPRPSPTFSSLPHNILLQIVYAVFPQTDCPLHGDAKLVRQRETLHWLQSSLRMVNSSLYIACMHILRSTYLPAYNTLIRAPYTSDPFPSSSDGVLAGDDNGGERPSLIPSNRELRTLDLFIALLTHEDLLLDSTSLHNPRHEAYKDLFVLIQPRSRLEDLVALEGKRRQLISLPDDTINNDFALPSSSSSSIYSEDKEEEKEPSTSTLRRSNSVLSLASETTLNEPSTSSQLRTAQKTEEEMDSPYVISIPPAPRSSSFYHPRNSASTSTLTQFPQMKRSRSIFSIFMSNKKGKSNASVSAPTSPPSTPRRRHLSPMPFSNLSVSISPRSATLMHTPSQDDSGSRYRGSSYGALSMSHNMYVGRKRAIVEVPRSRDEPLELTAIELVRGLRSWMEDQ
ncbi:hypothetical protein V5O48_003734, partial [Marasmius crinis-equi]